MPRSIPSARISAEPLTHEEIAALAHDLRTPLGGIDAMIHMLAQTPLSEEQTRLLSGLKAASAHLRGLADQVLGRRHPDSPSAFGLNALAMQPLHDVARIDQNILDFLESVYVSALARAQARGITFHLQYDPSEMQGYSVHPEPLRRVLENLLDNAMRATHEGEVRLDVLFDPRSTRLSFQLVDTGPGLTEAQAARLMRSTAGLALQANGSGLGLQLAATLVAEQGGTLIGGMRQDKKSGAEFRFDWPCRQGMGQENGQEKNTESILPCLVVDDHASGRLILKTILGAMGVLCDEAEDGEAAWQKLSSRPYRAVFTDIQMPKGGGQALLNRIAMIPQDQQPLTIVVSAALDMPSDIYKDKLDAVIQKPISIAAITEVVEKFCLNTPLSQT